MDPITAALTALFSLANTAIEARQSWWESLSPEKRTELADKYADNELAMIASGEKWREFFDKLFAGFQPHR